jgi:hypothetical protein
MINNLLNMRPYQVALINYEALLDSLKKQQNCRFSNHISLEKNELKCMFSMAKPFCMFKKSLQKISQYDLVLLLHEQCLRTNKIYEKLVEIVGALTLAYSTLTRTIRQRSWTPSEERPPNSRVDRQTSIMIIEFFLCSMPIRMR